MCLTVISIIVIYLYCTSVTTATVIAWADTLSSFYPETSKRSLEEMAAYFGETVLVDTDLDTEHKAIKQSAPAEKARDEMERAERIA